MENAVEKVDAMDGALQRMGERLTSLDAAQNEMNQRIANLEGLPEETRRMVIAGDLGAMSQRLDYLSQQLGDGPEAQRMREALEILSGVQQEMTVR
jgi:hypothetical protein